MSEKHKKIKIRYLKLSCLAEISDNYTIELDCIDLFYVDLTGFLNSQNLFLSYLSSDELMRVNNLRGENNKEYALCSFGVRREIISRYLQVRPEIISYVFNPNGKPVLKNKNQLKLSFNISHSHSRMLLGIVSSCDIGVDIQYIDSSLPFKKIAERFFKKDESEYFASLPINEAVIMFYNFWTVKEAYIKATGEGFSLPFYDVQVPTLPFEEYEEIMVSGKVWYRFSFLTNEEYAASLIVSPLKR